MDKLLIKNGLLMTMTSSEPQIAAGEILVEGSTIAGIGPDLQAEGCRVIDEPRQQYEAGLRGGPGG